MADLCPSSYVFKHCPRVSGHGGGVAFLHKGNLQVVIKSPEKFNSFECMSATISNDSSCMDISVIYGPLGDQSFSRGILWLSRFERFEHPHMKMSNQIWNICRSVRYQLRNIGFILNYLSRSATDNSVQFTPEYVVQAPEASKPCGSHCHFVQEYSYHPVLCSLQRLPVKDHVFVKLLLLTFHCIHGSAPQ